MSSTVLKTRLTTTVPSAGHLLHESTGNLHTVFGVAWRDAIFIDKIRGVRSQWFFYVPSPRILRTTLAWNLLVFAFWPRAALLFHILGNGIAEKMCRVRGRITDH